MLQEETKARLERFLPKLRLEVDKTLRKLCTKAFNSQEYTWILRAYLVSESLVLPVIV